MRMSFVRFVMGKPYTGEDWEQVKAEEKKSPPAPAKFTKSFQAYLDMVADDRKKTAEEWKTTPSVHTI